MTKERRFVAEAVGTAMLSAIAVGSSLMAARLPGTSAAIALLASAAAAGLGLLGLVLSFGSISGAHFNPLLSLCEAWRGKLPATEVAGYIAAQSLGAFAGVAIAHSMFDAPMFSMAAQVRTGSGQWLSEFVASFGLLLTFIGCSRHRGQAPFGVAAYVAAAFWFTSSSAFINPAMTLAKAMTSSGAGIRLADVPAFMFAQLVGAASATLLLGWLQGPSATGLGVTITERTMQKKSRGRVSI